MTRGTIRREYGLDEGAAQKFGVGHPADADYLGNSALQYLLYGRKMCSFYRVSTVMLGLPLSARREGLTDLLKICSIGFV